MSSSTRISRRRDGGRSEAEAGLARRVAAEAMPLSGGLAAVAGSAASASDRGAKSGDELGGLVASGFGVLGHVGVDPVADGAVAEAVAMGDSFRWAGTWGPGRPRDRARREP